MTFRNQRRRRGRRLRSQSRSGVSDVVATIILLALTVTLFASIFAFVTTFPSPPHQNGNQFQASMILSSNGQSVTGINITHLTGPSVPSTGLIYLKSSANPNVCPFTISTTVGSGISTSAWNLGQTWSQTFTSMCQSPTVDPLPDNITVYVVSGGNLLYSVILPGTQIVTPPAIVSTWITPNPVAQGVAFSVHASISGGVKPGSVYANLGAIPGLPGSPVQMTLSSGSWVYASTGGASSPGSFTGFVNATGLHGETTAQTVSLLVTSPSGALTASLIASPSSGTAPLAVSFSTIQSGGTGPFTYSWSFGDSTTATTTAGTASHSYANPGTYFATVTITDSKSNVVSSGTTVVATLGNAVAGLTYSNQNSVSGYQCVDNNYNCPNIYWEAWNNWTGSVTVSGTEYANASSGGTSQSWTIPVTVIGVNGNTGAVNPIGGHWRPASRGTTYTLTLVLKIVNTANGQVLGSLVVVDSNTISVS